MHTQCLKCPTSPPGCVNPTHVSRHDPHGQILKFECQKQKEKGRVNLPFTKEDDIAIATDLYPTSHSTAHWAYRFEGRLLWSSNFCLQQLAVVAALVPLGATAATVSLGCDSDTPHYNYKGHHQDRVLSSWDVHCMTASRKWNDSAKVFHLYIAIIVSAQPRFVNQNHSVLCR